MKIVFFNCFHNGDVHASRGLVRQVMTKVNEIDPSISFSYAHRNPGNLLADIPGLTFEPDLISYVGSEHNNLNRHKDMIFFNTWYGQQHFKYMNRYGITFDSLYAAFDDSCKTLWNFNLSDISSDPISFFPIIDYSKFEIGHAQKWISENPERKILIENGQSLSGQSKEFNMTQAIANVAATHLDKIFILSNQDNIVLPNNCIYASGIIKKSHRSDLNEISYLSSNCDLIIGKASGVFAFTITQQNLFQRSPKFLCFYNLNQQNQEFWLGELFKNKINYSATFVTHNEARLDMVQNIIQSNL